MPRTLIGNFKGPKGDIGQTGPQGAQGPQGPAGTVDGNSVIDFEVPETYVPPEPGNTIKVLLGKIAKGLSNLFDAVGVLASLKTVEKSTLVAAVNELADGKFDVAKIIASTNITEPGFAMDGKTASEAITELYSNKIKILTKNIRFDHPAGYFEYAYKIPEVDGKVICAIPILTSYQNSSQRPTWAYTGHQFWVNCEVAGYMTFNIYVFYE